MAKRDWGFLAAICAVVAFWIFVQGQFVVNDDLAFLTLAAQRMLDGQAMSAAYYDTNPPLSIMLQIPAVLLERVFSIPLHVAVYLYPALGLFLSLAATFYLLRRMKEFSVAECAGMVAACAFVHTVVMAADFGQKDQWISFALLPLALWMILNTRRESTPKFLSASILGLGSILILLKPHYGLIPAFLLAHRAIAQKKFPFVRDVDFWVLAGIFILYGGMLFLFFSDFLTVILPDTLLYYVGDSQALPLWVLAFLVGVNISSIGVSFLIKEHLAALLCGLGALCLIPFALQGKGWIYHAAPALPFFACALALIFMRAVKALIAANGIRTPRDLFSTGILVLLLLFLGGQAMRQPVQRLPPVEFRALPLAQKITQGCADKGEACSFFLFHDTINMAHTLSFYTGHAQGSRFPVPWFLPTLMRAQGQLNSFPHMDFNFICRKYGAMIAQDFARFQPEILFIGWISPLEDGGKDFDFKSVFSGCDADFAQVWADYDFVERLTVDRTPYFGAPPPRDTMMRYDLYRRKGDQ